MTSCPKEPRDAIFLVIHTLGLVPFVLFYVSVEITLGQFRFRESGYTQKRSCPRANAIYPWIKELVYPQLILCFFFFFFFFFLQ